MPQPSDTDLQETMTEYSTSKLVKARKYFECGLCFRKVMPGEEYKRYAFFGGDFDGVSVFRMCPHCVFLDKFINLEYLCHDDVLEYRNTYDSWDRAINDFLNKWEDSDGQLMPVPKEFIYD